MVRTLSAEMSAIHRLALVYLPFLAAHRTADQNARYIQIVLATELVLILSAKTHARDHVVLRLYAAF